MRANISNLAHMVYRLNAFMRNALGGLAFIKRRL